MSTLVILDAKKHRLNQLKSPNIREKFGNPIMNSSYDLSTRGAQSLFVSLLVTKGTLRYLTRNVPSLKPVTFWIANKFSLLTPEE